MIKSVHNAAHYTWGNNCDGWHLLQAEGLSVIEERMPPGTSEQLHLHHQAQQVFYILSGTATFEINGIIVMVQARESLHILPGVRHLIANKGADDLSFLVISQPKAQGDRQNLDA